MGSPSSSTASSSASLSSSASTAGARASTSMLASVSYSTSPRRGISRELSVDARPFYPTAGPMLPMPAGPSFSTTATLAASESVSTTAMAAASEKFSTKAMTAASESFSTTAVPAASERFSTREVLAASESFSTTARPSYPTRVSSSSMSTVPPAIRRFWDRGTSTSSGNTSSQVDFPPPWTTASSFFTSHSSGPSAAEVWATEPVPPIDYKDRLSHELYNPGIQDRLFHERLYSSGIQNRLSHELYSLGIQKVKEEPMGSDIPIKDQSQQPPGAGQDDQLENGKQSVGVGQDHQLGNGKQPMGSEIPIKDQSQQPPGAGQDDQLGNGKQSVGVGQDHQLGNGKQPMRLDQYEVQDPVVILGKIVPREIDYTIQFGSFKPPLSKNHEKEGMQQQLAQCNPEIEHMVDQRQTSKSQPDPE